MNSSVYNVAYRSQTKGYVDPKRVKPVVDDKVNTFGERIRQFLAKLNKKEAIGAVAIAGVVAAGLIMVKTIKIYLKNIKLRESLSNIQVDASNRLYETYLLMDVLERDLGLLAKASAGDVPDLTQSLKATHKLLISKLTAIGDVIWQ